MSNAVFVLMLMAALVLVPAAAQGETGSVVASRADDWLERFAMREPPVEDGGVRPGEIGALPGFTAFPETAREQLVRVSVPFPPGALPRGMGVLARMGHTEVRPDLRVLTLHPGQPVSVRRAILTFPYSFETAGPHEFSLSLAEATPAPAPAVELDDQGVMRAEFAGNVIRVGPGSVEVDRLLGPSWQATLIAPESVPGVPVIPEVVEWGSHYVWLRLLASDPDWPRIIEVRADSLGVVAVQAHVQRMLPGNTIAPDLGWSIEGPRMDPMSGHSFSDGEPVVLRSADGVSAVTFPVAPLKLRGDVRVEDMTQGSAVLYHRCRADDGLPFQSAAWRRAEFVVGSVPLPPLSPLLEPALQARTAPEAFDAVYGTGTLPDISLWPAIENSVAFAWTAVQGAMRGGDDLGNITAYHSDTGAASPAGTMRLEYAPAIFEGYYRNGNAALRDTVLLWCSNFFEQGIWWGHEGLLEGWRKRPESSSAGGTRHPQSREESPETDSDFGWRENGSYDFCTKGFDSFLYAYEETGDPRMVTALHWQTEYAREHIQADQPPGQTRNVGVASDFLRLYRATGLSAYQDEALRLFAELRGVLSEGDLFSQSGEPIHPDPPFIDDDEVGYRYPFAKPYILGYALHGLPELLTLFPDEPKLRDVVRAVADFLAESQDPTGGWRYPHPASSRNVWGQTGKTAAVLANAAAVLEQRGEPAENLIDAIERSLVSFVTAHRKTGTFLSLLEGWERPAGLIEEQSEIYDLYEKPSDRDPRRDYSEGPIAIGFIPPDGVVFFEDALRFYLDRRPAERLLAAGPELAMVLDRLPDRRIVLTPQEEGTYVRASRADAPEATVLLWGPESINLPEMAYSDLHTRQVDWEHDEESGAVWYRVEGEKGALVASFIPNLDYVECFYTVWPAEGATVPDMLRVAPCTQMKGGLFEGDDEALLSRLWYLSDGEWVSLGESASFNARNFAFLKSHASPEMTRDMAEAGWRTIHEPRPDRSLIACTSPDGEWVAATASEFSDSIANNANASHRCIHSQGQMPLRLSGPTTLRNVVYLVKGDLEGLKARHEQQERRWENTPAAPPSAVPYYDEYGVRDRMPRFYDRRVREMRFSLSWREAGLPFDEWREAARARQHASFLTPPRRAPFNAKVLEVEDRGAYEARKLAFNVNADCRVLAYLLVPKGDGPFPGILALHDHGAHFSIGKEKVIRPFNVPDTVLEDAANWTGRYYGGRYIGDELAARGYVVLSTDVTYWGDRGRMEGVAFEEQQSLAANMIQLGYSWSGYNAWDDMRSAEFLAGLPDVDPERVGAVGLSMGAYRTMQISAATDIVKAGAVICWLADLESFMVPNQNQTTGQSAFSMIHPGLLAHLDYPDTASIACPKPMLFFAGLQDTLFQTDGVQRAFDKMQDVWRSQGVEDRLLCRFYDVPHLFDVEMQEDAFEWLDLYLK